MLRHAPNKKLGQGKYYPLGATPQDGGVNFAIYSKHARDVFLHLFDPHSAKPTDVIRIEHRTRHVWHVFVHNLKPGQLYGYKIDGEFDPANGLRFNKNKLIGKTA